MRQMREIQEAYQVLLRGLRVRQVFLTNLERKDGVDKEVRRAAGIFQRTGRGRGREGRSGEP